MKSRIRLLPAVIFISGFAVALKLANVWQGVDGLVASPAVAEEQRDAGRERKAAAPAPAGESGAAAGTGEVGQDGAAATGKPAGGQSETTGQQAAWFDPASVTDAELEILQKLSERRKELESREKQIDVRARLLEATEKRIDSKIVELKEIQDTIAGLLKKHDAQQEAKMKSVVKIYESMKAKDAARIFEELDMAILLDVVERMREIKAAPIMAEMSPAKAKAMTAALAQRRALPKPETQNR